MTQEHLPVEEPSFSVSLGLLPLLFVISPSDSSFVEIGSAASPFSFGTLALELSGVVLGGFDSPPPILPSLVLIFLGVDPN